MWILRRFLRRAAVLPSDPDDAGIPVGDGQGHRQYVGDRWNSLGQLQLDFLINRGLRPEHVLLDVGCGSLRAGVRLIPYLAAGNYMGVDPNKALLDAGIQVELGRLYQEKQPEFLVTDAFEFARLSKRPDFAICQAVFMFLTDDQIKTCFLRLRDVAKSKTVFFATYWQTREPQRLERDVFPYVWHGHTRRQMLEFGDPHWRSRYIGAWGHPRGQMMVEYRPA